MLQNVQKLCVPKVKSHSVILQELREQIAINAVREHNQKAGQQRNASTKTVPQVLFRLNMVIKQLP